MFLACGLAVFIIAGLLLRRFPPTEDSWYPKCSFYSMTGLHCPGCGATRALRAIFVGDFSLAFRSNPLLIGGGPIVALVLFIHWKNKTLSRWATARSAWIMFAVLLSYSVLRNVPTPQSAWLAPPALEESAAQ